MIYVALRASILPYSINHLAELILGIEDVKDIRSIRRG